MSLPAKVRPIKAASPDTYHGVPVLTLRVGDAIPTPRAPERYAVRVYPDLARYILTFNAPNNRGVRLSKFGKYAADMRDDLWRFTPEPVVFTQSGQMQNGQHRMTAVCEAGVDVWMMFDFGWPDDIINALDRGAAKTAHDAFAHERIPSSTTVTSTINVVARYEQVKGQERGFGGLPVPSTLKALAIYEADPDGWQLVCRLGQRVYDALDRGFGPSVWAAAFRIIGQVYPDLVEPFAEAIAKGTDPAGSASRRLADWARRRPLSATQTGDAREPIEVIIRAFNAWRQSKPMSFPRGPGFVLSRVK